MRPTTLFPMLLALCALLALAGCSSLSEAMGLGSDQQAPVFVGVGVNAQSSDRHENGSSAAQPRALVHIELTVDATGDLGSTQSAGQKGELTQTVKVDPEAVANGIATAVAAATPGSAQAKMLIDAQKALDGGDAEGAAKLLRAAGEASNDPPAAGPVNPNPE